MPQRSRLVKNKNIVWVVLALITTVTEPTSGFLLDVHPGHHHHPRRSYGAIASNDFFFAQPSINNAASSFYRSDTLLLSSDRSASAAAAKPDPGTPIAPTTLARTDTDRASPRLYAVKALLPSFKGGGRGTVAFAVDRLESSLNYSKMSLRDRSFCRLLVATVERRLGQIDAVLAAACRPTTPTNTSSTSTSFASKPLCRKPTAKTDDFVEAVLRVGAAQLLFLHTPPHAAVKETVDVLRSSSKNIRVSEARVKFVNAVLRRLSREGMELLSNPKVNATVTANAAPWLVAAWRRSWGDEATHRIIAAAMEETPRCLTVNVALPRRDDDNRIGGGGGGDTVVDVLQQQQHRNNQIQSVVDLFDGAELLPQGSVRITNAPPGPISTWPLYQEGAWWCQDPSATIPAMALYQALSQRGTVSVRNMNVVDLCSAPGGKTAQLSNYGFGSVTAVEVSSNRCTRLEQNMKRLQMKWRIIVADGCEWIPSEGPCDAVLLDVPCTATGTASKRPDVLRRDSDYAELLVLQQRLARHAADSIVKVGGYLIYATCSLLEQESEDQVTELLNRSNEIHTNSAAASRVAQLQTVPFEIGEIPGFDSAIDASGWIRVIPGMLPGSLGQCDGFFVARLRRIA